MSEEKKIKIGILGAGQLARMMILNSRHLGVEFVLFCEKITDTTKNLAEHHVASLNDQEALSRFLKSVDVVTFESENYEEELADFVGAEKPFYPPKKALLTSQDRLKEKTLAEEIGIPTNQFRAIETYEDLLKSAKDLGLPLIVKARRFGYDGKHQYHIHTQDELEALEHENFQNFLAESFVPFSQEVSIVGVRGKNGKILFYDLCQNHHEKGILRQTTNIHDELLYQQAQDYCRRVMEHMDYVGVLTIEFFVVENKLLMNEMAPRVHNSGHWTIEGASVSQFENHVRAVAGLPLGSTRSMGSFRMMNCIGEMPKRDQVLQEGGAFHDYEKSPRPNRKLGHITYRA